MKKLIGALLVFAMSLSMVGCFGPGEESGSIVVTPPSADDAPITLKMWGGGTQWKGSYAAKLEAFIKDFNAGKLGEESKKLKTTIEYETLDSIEDIISTRVMSREDCADLMMWDRFSTPTYAYEDYLAPIDEYITGGGIDLTEFHPEALKEMNYYVKTEGAEKRHYYGLPIDVDTWGVYVNLDLVDAHNAEVGADSPKYIDKSKLNANWTWLDLYDTAVKLTGKINGNDVYGYSAHDLQQHFFKYFVSTGKNFLTDSAVPNIDNEEGKDVLKFFKMLHNARVSRDNVEEIHFVKGQVAMVNNPTYYGDYIRNFQDPNNPINYVFLPQPKYCDLETGAAKEGATNGGMMGGFGLAMPRLIAEYRDDAYYVRQNRTMNFIKWWSCGEGAKYWAQYSQTLPALTELYQDETVITSDHIKAAATYADVYKIRDNVRGFQTFQKDAINVNVETYVKSGADTDAARNTVLKQIINKARESLKI